MAILFTPFDFLASSISVRQSSIWGGGATGSHVNGSDVTRSDVSHMTGNHRKWRDRKYVLCMPGFFPRLFLTIVVVQNIVQVPWLPDVTWPRRRFPWVCTCTTGSCAISALVGPFDRKWHYETSPVVTECHVTSEGCSSGWGARMPNRKLRNIRSNVTSRASPGKYVSAHAWLEVPLGCSLWRPRPIIVFWPFHWLSAPFPPIYFHGECFQ